MKIEKCDEKCVMKNVQTFSRGKFLAQSLLLSPMAKLWIGCVWTRRVH